MWAYRLCIGFSGRNDESLGTHIYLYLQFCKAQNVEPGDALDCFIRLLVCVQLMSCCDLDKVNSAITVNI